MGGRPVWLASIARRAANGGIIPALEWPRSQVEKGINRLSAVLAGVGDKKKERVFRMCITLCMHRALADEEVAALPPGWLERPALDVAGGPVEIIYTRGTVDSPSVMPCENMARRPLPTGRDYKGRPLWVPDECGRCAPCKARDACATAAACAVGG